MGLKISFFGASLVSSHGHESASYFRGLLKALHADGHKICFYEPDALDRLAHRDLERPDYAKVIVYPASANALMEVLQEAADSDLIIKVSGVGILDAELEKGTLCLKHMGKMVAYWDVNAAANLDKLNSNPDDPFRKLIPQYDFIFISGGGQKAIDNYVALGAKNCHPIYPASDPSWLEDLTTDLHFAYDLAYVANRYSIKDAKVEEYFFDAALKLLDQSFVLGGKGWENKELLGNIFYNNPLRLDQHSKLFSSSKTTLILHSESAIRYGHSPIHELFEAAGAGSCVITDYWEGIEQFFEVGKDVLVARSGEDVVEILQKLTKKEAIAIGQAAQQKVLQMHTYAQRAKIFEHILTSKEQLVYS